MVAKYTNVGLPQELIEKLDKVIKSGKWGYKSRGEIVKEAVRQHLQNLIKLKE